MSSALDATIISLYSSLAFASRVAMNAEPTYAKSAPIARAARTERPFAIAPESASGPSNQARISWTSANGESRPACQPPVEHGLRARVQRRKRADDAGLALRDHEVGLRDDEQRRADDRDRERVRREDHSGCGPRPRRNLLRSEHHEAEPHA